jgi:hypothetical protein
MPGPADVDLATVRVHDDVDRGLPLAQDGHPPAELVKQGQLLGQVETGGTYE